MALSSAGGTTITGQVQAAGGDVAIVSGGKLAQLGTVDAAGTFSATAAALEHSGTTIQRGTSAPMSFAIAGDAKTSGTIYSAGALNVSAATLSDGGGQWVAEKSIAAKAQSLALSGTQFIAGADIALEATAGDLRAMQVTSNAGG